MKEEDKLGNVSMIVGKMYKVWEPLAVDIKEEEHSRKLLTVIVEKWITLRVNALLGNWLEEYKQEKRKSTKKVKGLRKGLKKQDQPGSSD